MRFYLITIVLFISLVGSAQGRYAVSDIPDTLKNNAVSVVRDYNMSFSQANASNGTLNVTRVITILNKQGDNRAHFRMSCDKFRELNKFSGIVRDASGSVIRKIKKSDLVHSNLDFDTFSSDNYWLYYDCQSPTYPFTVEYTYEVKYKNGIISYPSFVPINTYRQSLENASYQLELPLGTELRTKTNFGVEVEKKENGKNLLYTIVSNGVKAIPYEVMEPIDDDALFPFALFGPSDFCFDSYCGNLSDWKSFGLWQSKLLEGRDALPNTLVSKIKELTKDASTDREKVEILYEYLQDNTRYVSIQLGIGGWQPIDASRVVKNGFGDCKGLTNLMLSMLKSVGISSYYCSVYSGNEKKTLYEDYPSLSQMNHVILLVPFENDSIWLECTSATLPFGFVHKNIAGHDALVMTEEGGKICRLPEYNNRDKKQSISLLVEVSEENTLKGNFQIDETLDNAISVSRLVSADRNKQVDYINDYLKLPNIKLGNIDVEYTKSARPSATVKGSFEAFDAVNRTGNRAFIPVTPLNRGNYKIFAASERSLDIYISKGFVDIDTITYKLPAGFAAESLPKDISLKTQFGLLETKIHINGNNDIVYTQYLELLPGKYDKSAYKEIKDFFVQIDSALKRKLVIRKE